MSDWPTYPVVYEINTWVWLNDLSQKADRPVTLEHVPQAELERLASYGFDALWLMGVWQRSPGGRRVAQEHSGLQVEYRRALPDYTLEDVIGSPYAIYCYQVDPALGGDKELAVLRQRLRKLGLRLILDFVPNHLAVDHAWLTKRPERLVQGDPTSLIREPGNYFDHSTGDRQWVFAHGRDPNFDGWTDTVQLDYRRPDTRQAMSDVLMAVAKRCDGVRCDMAMLVSRDVFLRTWGGEFDPPWAEFWPTAIAGVKASHADFLMLAEVYWDLEWELQQQGFDYTYDKRLYDRLLGGDATSVRLHLHASLEYQRHLARFIENHDEERALTAFGPQRSRAVATLALALPGLRLLYEGQLEGRQSKLPVQLGRRRSEPPEPGLEPFYRRLLVALRHPVFHDGDWRLLESQREWPGNLSYRNFVAYHWVLGEERRLVVANLAPEPAQCFLSLDLPALAGRAWRLQDLLSDSQYVRNGDELLARGLYLDLPGYGYHLFEWQPM